MADEAARDGRAPGNVTPARRGAFRKVLGCGGRAHVDRPLPFLLLGRFDPDTTDGIARRVVETGSAYVSWADEPECDAEADALIGEIVRKQHADCGHVLLVSVYDLPRAPDLEDKTQRLESFDFRMSASDDEAAQAAARALEEALVGVELDLRHPKVSSVASGYFEPGIEALVREQPWLSHISIGIPQVHRVPESDAGIYPQLQHDLIVAIFDSLLQAFQAFIRASGHRAPAHHRALGRSSFIASAKTVDRKLDRIARSFDLLLGISPINTQAAFEQFCADDHQKPPRFRYRPLTVAPEIEKRRLYAIDLKRVEDPVLESVFAEKRRELDQQLTMLQCRNLPSFRYSSLMLYGPVEKSLRDSARAILDAVEPRKGARSEPVEAHEVRDAARALIERYQQADPDFAATIQLREDIAAGMMVSGAKLLISTATRMRRHRLDALLQHEVSIHLLTCINGNAQGLKIFGSGLAGYEGIQEGLGVFAECAVGGLTRARLRLLAARVLAVDAMIDGASFIDSFRLLHDQWGFGQRAAFNIAARVYRSGGLSKDAIYLRGFQAVLGMLARGESLEPFWFGKIAVRHIPVVEELRLRGLLHRPRVTPAFLDRPDVADRIAKMRTISSPAELL